MNLDEQAICPKTPVIFLSQCNTEQAQVSPAGVLLKSMTTVCVVGMAHWVRRSVWEQFALFLTNSDIYIYNSITDSQL